ncbi:hypothetical protein AB9F36_23775 [Rhizobium leguminosarum]|uniref:hypothetical protein n=1 Tax=Rhizobium leguminosarum TaxID=384 RepID=UPI003F99AD43
MEEVEAEGDALLRIACEHGLKSLIANGRNCSYRSGRLGVWLKIKCTQGDSFFIAGYEMSMSARAHIGRCCSLPGNATIRPMSAKSERASGKPKLGIFAT